jgi:excisionase family DNA binding protein
MGDEVIKKILESLKRLEAQQISRISPYFTVSEAAQYLRISLSSMRRLLKNGLISYQRIDISSNRRNFSKILITRKQLDLFVFYGTRQDLSPREIEKAREWTK